MQLQCLSILGVGLLGGSIAMAARQRYPEARVAGYGHRQSTLDTALRAGMLDSASTDPAVAVREADLIVLCTPVGVFEGLLTHIATRCRAGAVVTDVGSTKQSVVSLAESILPRDVPFVGSHPMAGSEKRGVEFARADLFEKATCILTPTDRTDPRALQTIDGFWQSLGMRTVRLSPELHDRHLADVSHLPHAIAAALVAIQEDEALALAGRGFWDTTRIASGDAGLWRDIFLDNRKNLSAGLTRLKGEIDKLLVLLSEEKADELTQWLQASADKRNAQRPTRTTGPE